MATLCKHIKSIVRKLTKLQIIYRLQKKINQIMIQQGLTISGKGAAFRRCCCCCCCLCLRAYCVPKTRVRGPTSAAS